MDIKEKILKKLYDFRVDFSLESVYTEFGIREEDFEDLAKTIADIFNEKPKEVISSCCPNCGEGYENDDEWANNTECELCGHPIPKHLIK